MSKTQNSLPKPHIMPYAAALTLVIVMALVTGIGLSFVRAVDTNGRIEFVMIFAAAAGLLLNSSLQWGLATPRGCAAVPAMKDAAFRERVTTSCALGALIAIVLLTDVTGLWAITSQFVGGFVLCSGALFFSDTVLEAIWKRIRPGR